MKPPVTSHTCKLTPEQAVKLKSILQERNYEFKEVPYAEFGASKDKLTVVYYTSGKLVIQGKTTEDFIQFILEPDILQEAKLGYEAVHDPTFYDPRIGVDESGKGDFFGPMCIAGVYLNETGIRQLIEAGIKDSKKIGSDRRIADLAKIIRETPGCIYSVVPIGNEAYNRLYKTMRSVNSVLAWGHARVIENLMNNAGKMVPPPVRAISDQFASSKEVVANALMRFGRGLELVQRHKAEEDVVVAAASILARDEFVSRLLKMEKQYGVPFPKGASDRVDAAAKEFFEKFGADELPKVAKMHFRTSARAQGLPEPPKVKWKKR